MLARWLWLCLLISLGGCAVQTSALREHVPSDLRHAVELEATPFFAQSAYQCGPAALATALEAAGLHADPVELAQQVFLPARTGTLQVEMIAGARRTGAVATRLPATLESLLREVQAGHPVVVLQNLGLSWYRFWHYAVLVGYDLDVGDVVLRSGGTRREVMPMRTFEHTWTRSGSWAFVVLPPGQWPATAQENAVVDASVGFERVAPPAQAVVVYRSAMAHWGDNLALQMGLGNSLYAAGDKPAAAQAFKAAAQQHHSAPAWINLANVWLELGRADDGLAAAREAQAIGDAAWQAQADVVMQQALTAARQ